MINFQANLELTLLSVLLDQFELAFFIANTTWLAHHGLKYSWYRSSENALDGRGHSTIPPCHSTIPFHGIKT